MANLSSSEFQLNENEKFACLAFEGIDVSNKIPKSVYLGNNTWILQKAPLQIDNHWKEWLGTLQLEHFAKSSLVILAKKKSEKPEILDEENKYLEQLVYATWYTILLDGIPHIEGGLFITGAKRNNTIDVRSAGRTDAYYRPHLTNPKEIDSESVASAKLLATTLMEWFSATGKFIRLKKGFHSWLDGLREDRADLRLHKYARMLESVIKPRIGKTSRDFVHRGKFFINHADAEQVLEEIYGIRSSVEHLNDWQESILYYPEIEREKIASLRAYQIQLVASGIIKKILSSKSLWDIFTDDSKIEEFWKLADHEKIPVLGPKIEVESICRTEFHG